MLIVPGLRTAATFAGRGDEWEYAICAPPGIMFMPWLYVIEPCDGWSLMSTSRCADLERSRSRSRSRLDDPERCDLACTERPEARPSEFDAFALALACGDTCEVGEDEAGT